MTETLPQNHAELDLQLQNIRAACGASEAQGILTGLLCGGAEEPQAVWLEQVFDAHDSADLLVSECRNALAELYELAQEELNGPGLGLTLLLPEEDNPIEVRARALRDWARGFLFGFGAAGEGLQELLSEEGLGALSDISEITRMDLDDLEQDDPDEDALFEVQEFIWVAAMLLREELILAREQAE